jgi:non-ribosomal peptide synthetase component F
MTQLPGLSLGASNDNMETEIRMSREISLPSPPPGITIATLFKAAWSFVLARLTSTQDLVFGQVVSGRNVPMNGAERVVGACVNIVPTRVTIESSWTALDLLYHVRDQHSRTIPFETIDLEEIVEKSTEWERGTGFGCIAQCQNIDIEPKFELAGVEFTSRTLAFQTEVTKDFYIVALPVGERLVVEIAASTRMLSAESAESIVGMVCDACLSFASEPDELLSLPSELFGQVQ